MQFPNLLPYFLRSLQECLYFKFVKRDFRAMRCSVLKKKLKVTNQHVKNQEVLEITNANLFTIFCTRSLVVDSCKLIPSPTRTKFFFSFV